MAYDSRNRTYNRLNTKPQTQRIIHTKSLAAVISDYFSRSTEKQNLLRALTCFAFIIVMAFSLAAVSTYTKHHSFYPQQDTYILSSKFAAKNDSFDESTDEAAFEVSLILGDTTLTAKTAPVTVTEFLENLNVDLTHKEPNIDGNSLLTAPTTLYLNEVDYVITEKEEIIPYDSVSEFTQDIPAGEVRTLSEGKNGLRKITYTQKYVNGELYGEPVETVEEEVAPVSAHVLKGEMGSFVGKDGVTYHYSDIINVSATAYVAPYGAYTYSGEQVSMEVIAVDTDVIDLGTEVYVECEEYFDPGYRRALDIGGLIIGNRIDVFMGYDQQAYNDAIQWGVRDAKVYILIK